LPIASAAPELSIDRRFGAKNRLLRITCPLPSRWTALRVLTFADLKVLWRSWLCRGFVIATALLTVLSLKGMEAEQKVASQMLEAVYVTYLLIWMHGVIFIAGAALSREQDCLNDAILSRGITRGEYISGKLLARSLAVLFMIGAVLVPCRMPMSGSFCRRPRRRSPVLARSWIP
jgi:hypothetical protein